MLSRVQESKPCVKRQLFRFRSLASLYLILIFLVVGFQFRSDMLLILTWFGHVFSAGQFVPVRSLLIGTTIFWLFPYCPLSRVLQVTLANPQTFGFVNSSVVVTMCI